MYTENNFKESAKQEIKTSLEICTMNITSLSEDIQKMLLSVDALYGGIQAGTSQSLTDSCHVIKANLERTLSQMKYALDCMDHISTEE